AEGLKVKAIADKEIKQQVESALIKVELAEGFQHRYPHELSGGKNIKLNIYSKKEGRYIKDFIITTF
ncbi:hypothetical protein EA736_06640, partial [Acinetobacter baumannii]